MMKKFISAAIAFAMTVGLMASMTVVYADGTTATSETGSNAENIHEGTHALKITGENMVENEKIGEVSQKISIEPGATYTLTYWYKGTGKLKFQCYYGYTQKHNYDLTTKSEWTQQTTTLASVTEKTDITIQWSPVSIGEGLFYIDDVVLTKVGDDTNLIQNGDFEDEETVAWKGLDGNSHKYEIIKADDPTDEPETVATKYFTATKTVDETKSYSKVIVTANNGEKDSAPLEVEQNITLEAGAGIIIGIMVENVPVNTNFSITSITLE